MLLRWIGPDQRGGPGEPDPGPSEQGRASPDTTRVNPPTARHPGLLEHEEPAGPGTHRHHRGPALSRFAAADAAPGRTRDASWQAGCIRLAGRVQANGPGAGWRRRSLAGLVRAGRPGAGPLQAGGPGALAGMTRSESRW